MSEYFCILQNITSFKVSKPDQKV